jgi:subtilisin
MASNNGAHISSSVDELLLAALERGDGSFETGRFLATLKTGAADSDVRAVAAAKGMRIADARDFKDQAAALEGIGDADGFYYPEIGVMLVGGNAALEKGMTAAAEIAADSAIASIDPEYFVFADRVADEYVRTAAALTEPSGTNPGDYLRGFVRAAETIAMDLAGAAFASALAEEDEQVLAAGATWGLIACRVPGSPRSGAGIKVAVLDTGMDLAHPDFARRPLVTETFIRQPNQPNQPVQDLHSHGTHCIGTACGPQAPAGATPRYGIAYRASIHAGKVLSNSGISVGGSVLAGMNWAIANRCRVISMSLGSRAGVQPYYTAAGQSALDNGLLMIASAGNEALSTGAPANSPTIMSVAALRPDLTPWPSSNFGKIEIAAPGVDVFSSVPRPRLHGFKSGTSMACPHVAGCAALWVETSATLRGAALWNKLRQTARPLPFPAARVGSGIVQAPAS